MEITKTCRLIHLERGASRIQFDLALLPFPVIDGVTVEDVSELLPPSRFEYMKNEVDRDARYTMTSSVKFALVHSSPYNSDHRVSSVMEQDADRTLNNLEACLKLIRPTREVGLGVRGVVREGSKELDFGPLWLRGERFDVPSAHKLNGVRVVDLIELRKVAPRFLSLIYADQFWAFRMSMEYFIRGFSSNEWKARYLLWMSALRALYGTTPALLAERIQYFLGKDTLMYNKEDMPEFEFVPFDLSTVGDLSPRMVELGTMMTNGTKIPDAWNETGRQGINGSINQIQQMDEVLCIVLQKSLLKIIREIPLHWEDHFCSPDTVETLWRNAGL